MTLHNLDILNAAVGLLSFLIFFIHWTGNKKPSLPNFLFRLFLIANAYYFIIAALIQNGGISTIPHLFRTGSLAGLLVPPLIYLILIKSLKNESWKKFDFLHFTPAILYFVDFIPFFILPVQDKLEIIESLTKNGDDAILSFNEVWIFNGAFWIVIKVLQPLIYSAICLTTIQKVLRESGVFFQKENRKLIQLLYWLSAYLFLITIPVGLSFAGFLGEYGWKYTSIILFFSTLVTCLFLLFNPEVLYGLKGIWIIKEENDPILLENNSKSKNSYSVNAKTYLSKRQVENMELVIDSYMNNSQAYLHQGFSLPQLAKDTNFQVQQVSAFLNQHKGENFNDYINRLRINHLILLYETEPSIIDQFTLEYLGKKCGFGSRGTFITAFKKFTGQTPSAYLKS